MQHPSPLPHRTTHQVYYMVPHQPLWNTPPPFPTALHIRWSTRYPTSLYGTPLPPFPTELHTRWSTRYPNSLYGTPLPPSPKHCTPGGLHGTPPAFMEHPSPPSPQNYTPGGLHGTPVAFMHHPSPLCHSTAHRVYYTVPHKPLWNTPPPFSTTVHTMCTTRYPISLYGTPLPPSTQHCTPGGLHGTPPAFMQHPSPLPHSTAHRVYYTVPHQPLWNTPPPFPTALHTAWSTRYPTNLYGTPLPPSTQHCTPGVLHGTPSAFMEHSSPLPHSIAHRVVYTVPHQPLWNTPPPFHTALHTGCTTRYPISLYGTLLPPSPQHCTPGGLHGTPPAFMQHPSPLPHSTAHRVYYTVPHQPLWNTPPPFPIALHTGCTTRYPISLYATPLPPSPQHCTPGVLHGTPPAFMEHPSPLPHSIAHQVYYMVPHQPLWNTAPPLPHSTAHRVYYTVPHQPLWNTPPPFPTALHTGWSTWYPTSLNGTPLPPSPQHCTPGVLHGTPSAFMEHPSPLPHSIAHQVYYMVPHQPLWNTAPPLPHSTAHRVYYTVPHQPLWNTPPPFPTALHTGWSTRYPTSLYGTPLPPSPQHCTPRVLHGTPPAFMEHPSPLPHSTAHRVVYTVPHQPYWNTPPPFPTALHTGCITRYPISLYGTPLPPSRKHCTPGVLHGTPSAFLEHASPLLRSTAHYVYYTATQQPLWNTPPPFPTALHTGWSTWYPTNLYGTPLPPSPTELHTTCTTRYPTSLYGTPPPPHRTTHHVYYTVPHQALWNTPPPCPTALHPGWSTRYPTSLNATPLPPSPQHCTPGGLYGTPPAFMEHPSPPSPQHCTPPGLHGTPPAFMQHPSPLCHSTAHRVYYTVPHQPLWNTPPPFPTSLHTMCTTRYPISLYGTALPPSPQHCTPGGLHGTPPAFLEHPSPPSPQNYTPRVLHGTPPAFMEHPSPLPHSTAHHVYYTVPHQPLWNTPPPSPQHCTPGGLHGTPLAFMEHPSPLPHSTAHRVVYRVPHQPLWNTPPPLPHKNSHHVYYTVPHQPLWNTPPPFPTALHTTCTTWYPTSLYGTPLPPSPQHCTPGGLHGTPPAFMEHPSPPSPQNYTPRGLHGTPAAFMQHPSPLCHSTAHRVYYTVPHQPLWNTPPPFPTALHTRWSTRYPTSLYGTPLPPFTTELHTRWSTRYPTNLYATPLPPSPQHCTPGGLHGTPPAFMEHPSPLPHSTAHQVVYTVPHQPLWNTPPPFPTTLHTMCTTRYPISLYGTPLPPSPQHCTPGGLHGTPPAFMEHPSPPSPQNYTPGGLHGTPPAFMEHPSPPSPQNYTPGGLHGTPPTFMEHPSPLPHSTAHQVVYTVPHQPLCNTPPPFPTALHTGCTTRYPITLYGTPLPPSP